MDIIAHAQAKRDDLQRELARIEAFLATAFELEHELGSVKARDVRSDAEKADAPARKRAPSVLGSGSATVQVVVDLVADRGPMSTKELLPLVQAKGIEVGGKQPLATLAARISGKGRVTAQDGKWHLSASGAEALGEEAAELPEKEGSAASLFHSDQGERHHAAALAH